MGITRHEWRRLWWFGLTLVPFGLLAPVIFAVAGLRAGRRDWLAWAGGYALYFWGAVAVSVTASLDHLDRVVGAVLLLGTPVPIVHAFLIRRPYLDATPEPDPHARARGSARRSATWLRLGGVVLIGAGCAAAANDDPEGLVAALFGLGLLLIAPNVTREREAARPRIGPVHGRAEPGLVFDYAASTRRSAVTMAVWAAALALMAMWADDVFDRVAAGVAVVILALLVVSGSRSPRERSLALTARGIWDGRGGGTFVPWEAIEELAVLVLPAGVAVVGLVVDDRSSIETSKLARLLERPAGRSSGDVTYAPGALGVEPETLMDLIGHYWQHPEARRELGTHRAVERFDEIVREVRAAHQAPAGPSAVPF